MQEIERFDNEEETLYKAIEGNKEAFGLLYDRYTAQIFRYFHIRTSDVQISEDLTETVFIRAWTHLPNFGKRGKGKNFRAWLFQISHHLLVDFYRASNGETEVELSESLQEKSKPILVQLEIKERNNSLIQAVRALEDKYQHVIIARFSSGLTIEETAKSLGLSNGNVRVIQYRALKKLKEYLREEND